MWLLAIVTSMSLTPIVVRAQTLPSYAQPLPAATATAIPATAPATMVPAQAPSSAPTPIQAPATNPAPSGVPSYAKPNLTLTLHGRIRSVDTPTSLTVADENGYLDSIQLGHGTIIYPTGLILRAGMPITIIGTNNGSVFHANEIDLVVEPVPYGQAPVYVVPRYWYPGYPYAWGPAYDLRIGIGGH